MKKNVENTKNGNIVKTSDAVNEISKAMALAQGEMKPAVKDSTNPHFRSKFADIASVWASIREPLSKNGIAVLQEVTSDDARISVTTRLTHASGQWIEFGPLTIPLAKKDAHGVGSATTYAKRYALAAAVGAVSGDEDDDGNASVKPTVPEKFIVEEQIRTINELLDGREDGDKMHKIILERLNIPHVGKIPEEKYDSIKKFLEGKINGNQ